jgi:AcrR family transcriptional regulator
VTVLEGFPSAQRAPAKGRILDTANVLFYEVGIHSVGVDRIIGQSSVTKATFYKHYRAKDNLIVDYITSRHYLVRSECEAIIAAAATPAAAILAIVAAAITEINAPGFRGCPFINAAAEYPEDTHAVRRIISEHREWFVEILENLLKDAGHPFAGDAADELLLARDGAMAGGYAGDSIAVTAAFDRVAQRVLAATSELRRG